MSFIGHREYQYGDDVRLVDWNVTARHTRPHVKMFEQERASAMMLVLDASASMHLPDDGKWQVTRDVAGLLALIAAREGDLIGANVVTSRVEGERLPARGVSHANALVRWFGDLRPQHIGTGIEVGVRRAIQVLRHHGVIVIVSDFLTTGWSPAVRRAARRHIVVGVRVVSPIERVLPQVGLIRVQDSERSAWRWIDTGSEIVRTSFAAKAKAVSRGIRDELLEAGAIPLEVATDDASFSGLRRICRTRGA